MTRVLIRLTAFIFLILTVVTVTSWFVFQPPVPPQANHVNFALEDVTIVNPTVNRLAGATISTAGGKVRLGAPADGLERLDAYRGMYVLPGFIDMHAHTPPSNALKLTGHYGLLNLAYGVTTIRDAGDIDGTAIPAVRLLKESGKPFPRIVSCGPFVSNGVAVWPNTLQLNKVEDARNVASRIAAGGHQCIKAYEGLTPELTAALMNAAEEFGMHVIGHVPVEYTMEQSGIVDVQHFFGIQPPMSLRGESVVYRTGDWAGVTPQRLDDVIAYIIENEIRNTPTLSLSDGLLGYEDYSTASQRVAAYMPGLFTDVIWHPEHGLPVYRGMQGSNLAMIKAARVQKLQLLRRLSDAGAILHLGTDTGQPFTPPGVSLWREMRIFEEAGIAAEKILGYATTRARRSLDDQHVILTDGAPADFLIFKEDPTETLEHLDSLVAVVIDGELYTREALQSAIEKSLDHYNGWPVSAVASWSARRTISTSVGGFD